MSQRWSVPYAYSVPMWVLHTGHAELNMLPLSCMVHLTLWPNQKYQISQLVYSTTKEYPANFEAVKNHHSIYCTRGRLLKIVSHQNGIYVILCIVKHSNTWLMKLWSHPFYTAILSLCTAWKALKEILQNISHCRWKPETTPKMSYDLKESRDLTRSPQTALQLCNKELSWRVKAMFHSPSKSCPEIFDEVL